MNKSDFYYPNLAAHAGKLSDKLELLKPGLENSNSSAEDALVDLLPDLIRFLKSIQNG